MKALIQGIIRKTGLALAKTIFPGAYIQDGLVTGHNHDFMKDAIFLRAYQRGLRACQEKLSEDAHWRVHVVLWVAGQASRLDGDFVECGVNQGFLSSAIMNFLNWNSKDKRFFLFDTWKGFDQRLISDEEKKNKRDLFHGHQFHDCYEQVQENFKEFRNVFLIRGSVPESLANAQISRVAYLSLDMNLTIPEIAAAEHFWGKIVPGGFILLDDYAYKGYGSQKAAFDDFAKNKGVQILSLPTGQGLILKPPFTTSIQ